MTDAEQLARRWRANVLFAGYGVVLLFLFLRVLQLQVARHEVFLQLSDQNRLRPVVEQPIRGRIYDRNGLIIVDNRPSWTVTITPPTTVSSDSIISEVATILSMSSEEIIDRLRNRKGHQYTPVPIKRDVSFEVVARLRERGHDLPYVGIQMEPRRRYPYGVLASHALGYLREIDEAQLSESQRLGEDYLFGDLVGKDGVERAFEQVLKGRKGIRYIEVDARGRTVRETRERTPDPPVHGRHLITTLDIELQGVAEAAFHDTARGAVVVMDPRNGALLVMASLPRYDPLDFSGVLDAATWDSLNSDQRKPLLNRVLSGLYPPASVFKLVTAAAGLQKGVIDTATHFDPCVPGGWGLGIRDFQCWKDDHGALNIVEAMEQSCDVFFYQVGVNTGLSDLHTMANSFGLGLRTGIALPGELAGIVPDAQYYDRTIGSGEWIEEGQVINLAIGQGELLSTPLQVAVMTSVIANGGYLVTPYLVDYTYVGGSDTRQLWSRPRPVEIEDVSMEYLELIREGMIRVVNGENGTARHVALRVPGVLVAGKTGTGQNPHGEDHAWFTAFAPADDPEIVVTVLVENGGGGSAVAAPIAAEVLRTYFRNRSSKIESGTPLSGPPR